MIITKLVPVDIDMQLETISQCLKCTQNRRWSHSQQKCNHPPCYGYLAAVAATAAAAASAAAWRRSFVVISLNWDASTVARSSSAGRRFLPSVLVVAGRLQSVDRLTDRCDDSTALFTVEATTRACPQTTAHTQLRWENAHWVLNHVLCQSSKLLVVLT